MASEVDEWSEAYGAVRQVPQRGVVRSTTTAALKKQDKRTMRATQ